MINSIVKPLSRGISAIHNKAGFTAFTLDGADVRTLKDDIPILSLVTTTTEDEEGRIPGNIIYPKDIRRFLFNWRNDRRATRENAVLITAYDKEKNVSFIGLAALVPNALAERFIRRRPTMAILEV